MKKIICKILKKHKWESESGSSDYYICKRCGKNKPVLFPIEWSLFVNNL